MSSTIKAVLYHPEGGFGGPSGDLELITASTIGTREIMLKFRSFQVVGIWSQRPNTSGGGYFTDEFSLNSAYAVVENGQGILIMPHDSQPAATRCKQYNDDDTTLPIRVVSPKLTDAMMGQGACIDVLDDGNSTLYDTKLDQARALALA